eukprot:749498-Hanusia_phi.AAC.1
MAVLSVLERESQHAQEKPANEGTTKGKTGPRGTRRKEIKLVEAKGGGQFYLNQHHAAIF